MRSTRLKARPRASSIDAERSKPSWAATSAAAYAPRKLSWYAYRCSAAARTAGTAPASASAARSHCSPSAGSRSTRYASNAVASRCAVSASEDPIAHVSAARTLPISGANGSSNADDDVRRSDSASSSANAT